MRSFLREAEARALREREERIRTTRGALLPRVGPDVHVDEVPDLCAETQRQLAMQREARRVQGRRLRLLVREDGLTLAESGRRMGLSESEVEALWAFVRRGGAR